MADKRIDECTYKIIYCPWQHSTPITKHAGFSEQSESLVRVRALVMARDDSTGGWSPLAGGALSVVGVYKIQHDDISRKNEYLIYGQMMDDQSVVLECMLRKDATYTKVNPVFHHWKTEDKRFGLTFQSTADARAFDRGVKRAIEDLNDGTDDMGDDDVFVSFESLPEVSTPMPMDTRYDGSQSDIRDPLLVGFHQFSHPHANHHHLHRVHYVSRNNNKTATANNGKSDEPSKKQPAQSQQNPQTLQEVIWVKHSRERSTSNGKDKDIEPADESSDCYVEFQKTAPSQHDYSYPTMESVRPDPWKGQEELKKSNVMTSQPPPLLGDKRHKVTDYGFAQRARCIYCSQFFNPDDNQYGNCPDAPDEMGKCINKVSCVSCASCMLYYCMSDADGDYGDTCSCDTSDEQFWRRWAGLTALSFLVPCLWCYFPLRLCHKCGVSCGCCGGRHKAV
ncbi:sprouty-related, EVH1 domain-containing protein 2-like isoform X2 [Ptychodera flava]|uniref:sprouty-related, EVH1 domain-containing protein 2-like isoform X2 n=1 Tax=Ptychodera flava TaxID=63121 RepID=UPI003969F0EB